MINETQFLLFPFNSSRSAFSITMLVAWCCLCFPAFAQETESAKKIADIRVVIDVSGSMKQNDPNNLRQPALELLVKLLPDESKAGVWTFGKYINMLVPHRDVNAEWRATALKKGEDINSTGLFTNIGEALEKAAYDIDNPNPHYQTSIILLTDGVVDIDREPDVNKREWRRIVDEILPKLKRAGYRVHTIALSDNADIELMNKLAISTDGIASVANSADELMKIFLAAFDNAAPAEQLPLQDNSFVVDSSVEEFTALIFTRDGSAPTRLESPEGKKYTFTEEDPYVRWYRSDKYDLITVEKPIEGEWKALADLDPDSRITVVSNLNLVVKPLKNNLRNGETQTLSLLLSEEGNTITRANFLELLDIQYTLTRALDGEIWRGSLSKAGTPANGIYSTDLAYFDEDSDYDLRVFVDGKSFNREFKHSFSVRQPFSVTSTKLKDGAQDAYQIMVSYYGDDLNRAKTKIAARVKDPEGSNAIKTFSLSDSDTWTLHFIPTLEGRYEFALRINAVAKDGKSYEHVPTALTLDYQKGADLFEPAPPVEPDVQTVAIVEPPAPQLSTPSVDSNEEAEIEEDTETASATVDVTEPEAVTEDAGNKWMLYLGLGLGNVVILVLAYFAYRMIMGNKRDPELEQLEQAVAELDKKETSPPAKAKAPTMADMDTGSDEPDDAPPMMSEDLNIAAEDSDDTAHKLQGEMPPMHQADDGKSKSEDLGVTDVEFSLDDFSSEDIDDD